MDNPRPKAKEDAVKPFHYSTGRSFRLPQPETSNSVDFFEVLHNRRSEIGLSSLDKMELGTLLWHSAKVSGTHVQQDGYILSQRPSPSAGARHPIDLLIVSPAVSALMCYYNPFEHVLYELLLPDQVFQGFIDHVNQNVSMENATLIWMIAHPQRTMAKYNNAESLIWRDAGALLQCIQMVSTALGLCSTPLGTLGLPYINQLFENTSTFSCGGIIISKNLEN